MPIDLNSKPQNARSSKPPAWSIRLSGLTLVIMVGTSLASGGSRGSRLFVASALFFLVSTAFVVLYPLHGGKWSAIASGLNTAWHATYRWATNPQALYHAGHYHLFYGLPFLLHMQVTILYVPFGYSRFDAATNRIIEKEASYYLPAYRALRARHGFTN